MPITQETKTNTKNNQKQIPKLDNKLSKKRDRKEYSAQRYQAKKQDYHQWYLQRKVQQEKQQNQAHNKYYQASNIKVLMTFKEYTELNQEKMKLWTDFNWTLKDCQEDIKEGFGSIEAVMKLEQVANNLISDYWETAKKEIKKGKSWNSLDYDQQQKLIKYWGYEKVRVENGYIDTAEELEKQSQTYLKDIELAKFHEERGKIKCECYQCSENKKIQGEFKAEIAKESEVKAKVKCPECQKLVRKLDEESGVCASCLKKYE